MPMYTATVTETISREVSYRIEADSIEEAQEKAAIGDTESEETVRDNGVLDRQVADVAPAGDD